jgi:hypothetical protein
LFLDEIAATDLCFLRSDVFLDFEVLRAWVAWSVVFTIGCIINDIKKKKRIQIARAC